MCGIAGYWGKGDGSVLSTMIDAISYRGPDDKGANVMGTVGIAHRRLSILDLTDAGHQPMSNADGTIWIVFNGEIYNFLELKKELSDKYVFKSNTDTEVIIHLYEEMGERVFEKIQGMFAIAIYDSNKNKLILARDRMGKKPLFWGIHNKTFLFGSELKALFLHPDFKKEIDLVSLNKYFLYEYVPTPHSIFKNTFKLEPGTYLVWDGERAVKHEFWKPTFLPKSNSFSDSILELDKTLEQSVADRLVADVPVGIFLSGGLDSSLVSYYASKISKTKIKTFSIGFKEKTFDESDYARRVAEFLGTEHHEKILEAKDCLTIIPQIAEMLDEPMADASIIPTYLLSQFTKESVTVALGGDGGDELFCGYDTFTAHRVASIYENIPLFVRKNIIEKLISYLPTSHSNMSLDFKLKKFIEGFNGEKKYRNQRWLGAFSDIDRQKLFKESVWQSFAKENEFDDILRYENQSDSKNFYDLLTFEYERLYMMDQILVKVDRASMFNSLEVRAPLLDTRIVDLANRMPIDFKFKGLEKKYILKKLAEGKLPDDIIYRKKKGFGIPVGEWLRGDLRDLMSDLLSQKSLEEINLFNIKYVNEIIRDHLDGKKDNRKQLWTLLVFVMWWRQWMR